MNISLLFENPTIFFVGIISLIIALSFHEFAHAFAAHKLGDDTAKDLGRLTLNPLSHLSLMGTLFMLFANFGWGKPVPFNPYNLKNQKYGPAIVAIAGPISNLILVIFFGLIFKFIFPLTGLGENNALYVFLTIAIVHNTLLMVFNLLPIPPLDGSKIAFVLLPESMRNVKDILQQYGVFILIFLVVFGGAFLSPLYSFALNFVLRLFIPTL